MPKGLSSGWASRLAGTLSALGDAVLRGSRAPRPTIPVAVCLHIFYDDIALEILDKLEAITSPYKLFVTHTAPLSSDVIDAIGRCGCPYQFMAVSNLGRDVRPFLQLVASGQLDGYSIVCKLHTKRDDPRIGPLWRNACVNPLIGDPERFAQIATAMARDRTLMMIGPDLLYKSAKHLMYGNRGNISRISSEMMRAALPDDWGFFAGTMFFVRRELLRCLDRLEERFSFDREDNTADDGQLTHALERLFGALPVLADGKIGLAGPELKIFRAPGNPSRTAVTGSLRQAVTVRPA